MALYTNGEPAGKWHVPPQFAPKQRRLGWTAHKGKAWAAKVGLVRVVLTTAYMDCPAGVRGDAASVGDQIYDNISELDSKAIHVLRTVFGILYRLSIRSRPMVSVNAESASS
jgi:hypothetical protein